MTALCWPAERAGQPPNANVDAVDPLSGESAVQKMAWNFPRHFYFIVCNPANRFGEMSRSSHGFSRLV